MEVRFFLTAQDVWNFQKYNRSRPRRFVPVILFFTISCCFSLGVGLELKVSTIILLLIVLVIILLVSGWSTWQTHRKVVLHLTKEGEQIITITPENFRERTLISDTILSWEALKIITADKYNLYFFLNSPNVRAYIIPRRAFATPQDADTFLGWAKSYWAHGHSMQQPGSPGSVTGYEQWG